MRQGHPSIQSAGILVAMLLVVATTGSAATASSTHKTKHSASLHKSFSYTSSKKHHTKTTAATSHGQHSIDQERTLQIQEALIREHYMSGDPTGVWDQASKDAMTRFQADNGWQTKLTPDSRALIKLGLGPDHKGLLNPETAVIASPHELGVDSPSQPGGAADQQ